jgi:hypothetical protein
MFYKYEIVSVDNYKCGQHSFEVLLNKNSCILGYTKIKNWSYKKDKKNKFAHYIYIFCVDQK